MKTHSKQMADYSIYEDSSSSWKDKYEGAIRDLQKDLQDTVLLAQSYAETNAEGRLIVNDRLLLIIKTCIYKTV